MACHPGTSFYVGLVGNYWQADSPANVSVYADGRVVVVAPDARLGYVTFLIDPAAIDELLPLAATTTRSTRSTMAMSWSPTWDRLASSCIATKATPSSRIWALEHDSGLPADQRRAGSVSCWCGRWIAWWATELCASSRSPRSSPSRS